MKKSSYIPKVFQHQPDAVLNQAGPVQNTWYSILDTLNARIYGITVSIATTNETLELRVTLDGVVYTSAGGAVVAGADWEASFYTRHDLRILAISVIGATPKEHNRSFLCEGRQVLVEVRKTTVAGAGNLQGCVSYGQTP